MYTAVLVAEYTALVGHTTSPAIDDIFMIPDFFVVLLRWSSNMGITFLVIDIVPKRFTLISLRCFSSDIVSKNPTSYSPALLIRRLMSKSRI
jgi:hypothetical protein